MKSPVQHTGRFASAVVAALLLAAAPACNGGLTEPLLEVIDPDLILPSSVNSLAGARAVATGALGRFRNATAGAESMWMYGGLMTDEWATSSTFVQNDETDQRKVQPQNTQVTGFFRNINRVRTAANQAIPLLRQYDSTNTALIAEMYFARGFAEMQLAQDFCNGIPLSNAAGDEVVYDAPRTVAEVFAVAVASFDSAITIASKLTDAQSTLIANAAKVGKGRALMGLNRYADAAAAVAGIPTTFKYQHTFSLTTSDNIIWNQGFSAKRYSVGDSIEGNNRDILVKNAIPFTSAQDPRLPVRDSKFSGAVTIGQDGGTVMRLTTIYDRLTSIDVVNGIDARLIEAEAKLAAGDITGWLATLNGLRNGPGRVTTLGTVTVPSMPNLVDPGNTAARVSLTFREKAFWTFSRGQRLGDLRRLIRQYGRAATDVFPEGVHFKAGTYGTDVNFPVVTDEENNPNFKGCIDRKA